MKNLFNKIAYYTVFGRNEVSHLISSRLKTEQGAETISYLALVAAGLIMVGGIIGWLTTTGNNEMAKAGAALSNR